MKLSKFLPVIDHLNGNYGKGNVLRMKATSYGVANITGHFTRKPFRQRAEQRPFRIQFKTGKATVFACGHQKTIKL